MDYTLTTLAVWVLLAATFQLVAYGNGTLSARVTFVALSLCFAAAAVLAAAVILT